jgi:multiple sugar transport system substrate-binding protein
MQLSTERRKFLKAGLAAVAGPSLLSLVGCAGQGGSTTSTVPLKLEFWGTTERDKRTKQVIDLFQKSHPNVKVSSSFTDFASYWTKLGTEISAGNPPDLLQMDMAYLAQYIQKDLLVNLSKHIPKPINLSDFDSVLLKGCEYDGSIYGIPLGGNYQVSFYRTDMLAKAGVSNPDPGMTWEQFAVFAKNISKALGKGVWGTEDGSNNGIIFEVYLRQRGKGTYTKEGQLGYGKQELVDWWSYWEDMRGSGACVPADLGVGVTTAPAVPDSLLINGKTAFHYDWSNLIVAWQKFSPNKLGMAIFPQGSTGAQMGHYFKVSQMISVSSKTKHLEDALNFVDFMINDTGAIKALDIERGVPGPAKAHDILRPQLTDAQLDQLNYITLAAKYASPKTIIDPPAASQVSTAFGLYAGKVGFKQLSISDAADQFLSEAQKLLTAKK